MTSRLKEEERNERTIRNLLKLPENRRCINCNSLGPQYVCTNFWTFVCTTCSGIHREFTHRVKSVSMAKFTSQEVSALQGGGNASAKEIYFKEWDTQRQSLPDSSNIERLRDFIKQVYVDRRYTGEKSFDKPSRVKVGEAEDTQGGSRSPPFENERRYSERPSPGGRSDDRSSKNTYDERQSPGNDQDFRRSPAALTDTVKDWQREDRFRDSKVEGKSPDHQKVPDISSPPIIRPVRDILGDKVSPLRVIEPPKNDVRRASEGSLSMKGTVSSSSLTASNRIPAEQRTESSLIDFDVVPEPPTTAQVPPIQQTAPTAPIVAQPTSSSNNNWASFDSVQEVKASHPSSVPTSSSNNLLDVLSELSVPTSTPMGIGASTSAPGGSFFPSNTTPLTGPSGNVHASSFGATAPVSAPISHSTITPGGAQTATPGPNAFAKKELPVDLFTSYYSSYAAPAQGWFPAPQYGMGYNMQYNVPTPMPPAYLQPSRPSNPFDVHESSSVQATTFPSMAPLQGALPNMLPPSGIHRTSSLGNPPQGWMPTQSSHPLPSSIQRTSSLGNPQQAWMPTQSSHPLPSSIHRTSSLGNPPQAWMPIQSSQMTTQVPSYGSGMPSGQFMVQGAPNMQPPPRPQVGGFGSYNINEQQSGPSFTSAGGNPFG